MSESAPTLGARLKTERERRGLSAAKAADELHLDGWVVDALEAEDYARVGPAVYAKGHLRRYAGLLGLPIPEVMAAYEGRVQAPKPSASPPAAVRLRTGTPAVSNLPLPLIAGALAVSLLIIGVIWWKPWQQRGAGGASSSTVAATPGAAATFSAAAPDSAAGPAGDSRSPSSGAGSAGALPSLGAGAPPNSGAAAAGAAAAADPMAGTGRARLRLSFSADSWVDVHDAAGRRAFSGKGRANSVKVIHGVAPMRVYLGFASGVQLEINDRAVAIGPQFVAGDVARFEAGADGVLRHDSHAAATTGGATPGAPLPGAAAPGVTSPAVTPTVQSRNARPPG
jgi:cytoskeleton protein RodZ